MTTTKKKRKAKKRKRTTSKEKPRKVVQARKRKKASTKPKRRPRATSKKPATKKKTSKKKAKKKKAMKKQALGLQLELAVLGEPTAHDSNSRDPQEVADDKLVAEVISQKNAEGIPLTQREMTVYKRWLNRNIVRFRDAGMRALPQKDLEGMLGTPRKVLLGWEAEGLPRNADKTRTYDLFAVLPWIKARWLGQAKGTTSTPEASDARQRRLVAEADKKELEVGMLRRTLISQDEVTSDRVAFVVSFTNMLDRLPVEFRSAFAAIDVQPQANWLDAWQTSERERLIEQGGVPAESLAGAAEESKEATQ